MNRGLSFSSFNSSATKQRELTIKAAITRQLSESIKELQLRGVDDDQLKLSSDDGSASGLCQAMEAMFLHGLKDSLAYRVRRALADVDECPQPSFWAPILVISHRQILDVIEHGLCHIATEVGQCRAWIRLALNDGLLSSYLATLLQQQDLLRPYYQWYAYLRDTESLGVARSLLEGAEGSFTQLAPLPTNSSILNTWAVPSLVLAGVWVPTMKEDSWSDNLYANSIAVDVARTLTNKTRAVDPERASTTSMGSFASLLSAGMQRNVPYTEDEALQIILAKTGQKSKLLATSLPIAVQLTDDETIETQSAVAVCDVEAADIEVDDQRPAEATADNLEHSYNELFRNMIGDQKESHHHIGTPDLSEMVKDLGFNSTTSAAINVSVDEGIDEGSAVSVCSESPNCQPSPRQAMWHLARERGLDKQKYRCSGCAQPISHMVAKFYEPNQMHATRGYVCYFSGMYCCLDCMADRNTAIPARILHNWDFKEYPISLTALNYIEESQACLTVDVGAANPLLYEVVPEMARCLDLRVQLTLVRAYLQTCAASDEVATSCCADIKEYMLKDWGLCSLQDFLDVHSGVLRPVLEKAVHAGREHVMGCRVCSQRGFLCEICKDAKPIFPFDLFDVYRCDICGSVSHKDCLTTNSPCRKCLRKKKIGDMLSPAMIV